MNQKNENLQKKIQFLIYFAYYFLIILLFFVLVKFVVPFLTPFIVGFSIAFILKPLTCLISSKTSLSRKICGTLVVIMCYCLIITFLWLICSKIVVLIQNFSNNNQGFFEQQIMPLLKNLNNNFTNFVNKTFPHFNLSTNEMLETILTTLDQTISENSKAIVIWVAKIGATIPNFLIGLTFAITSSIYISSDYVKITTTLNNLMPNKLKNFVKTTKWCIISAILKYCKAYFFLMLINFFILTVGFFILNIENPIGMAAITLLFDAIPIFGSFLIVLPWVLSLLIMQQFSLAIKIILIFLFVNILRSFLEPKILGKQIGIHPILTLISVYLGMKLFGLFGTILIPIIVQISFSIYKSYKFK